MIVVTGGAGFIGYNLVFKLKEFYYDVVVIDNNIENKIFNLASGVQYMTIEDSFLWLGFNKYHIDAIFHLGARTDTMEKDVNVFNYLNFNNSKFIWNFCTEARIPLIYASSAAVYGNGDFGFDDNMDVEWDYYPMNPYGESKYWFDHWVREQIDEEKTPPFWAGLRFFNVYGNYESHKGKMASVVWHLYNQIKETGGVKLFRSHRDDVKDGEQMRDFIHVNDVVNTMIWLYLFRKDIPSDIYNLGTGKARTYNDLARAIFKSLDIPVNVSYIDTPIEIRDSYQYYTQAKMNKLCELTFGCNFMSLEEGINMYISQLENEK